MEKEIISMSCTVWPIEDMPSTINTIDKKLHFCMDTKYERATVTINNNTEEMEEDGDCIARKDGSFWIVNTEYLDMQVKYCPHCGAKAPNQNISSLD